MIPKAPCEGCPITYPGCGGMEFPSGCEALKQSLIDNPDPAPEFPPLARQAASAVKAVIGHFANGLRAASPEAQASRRATCSACPNWDAPSSRCRLCGCRLDWKISMASESCPDSPPRWKAE